MGRPQAVGTSPRHLRIARKGQDARRGPPPQFLESSCRLCAAAGASAALTKLETNNDKWEQGDNLQDEPDAAFRELETAPHAKKLREPLACLPCSPLSSVSLLASSLLLPAHTQQPAPARQPAAVDMAAARGPKLSGLQVRRRREPHRSGCPGWSGTPKHWTSTADRRRHRCHRLPHRWCGPAQVHPAAPRLSLLALQRQVLSLYRAVLRVSRAKEQQGGESIAAYARMEIERWGRQAGVFGTLPPLQRGRLHIQSARSTVCWTRLPPRQHAHDLMLLAPAAAAPLLPRPGPTCALLGSLLRLAHLPASASAHAHAHACRYRSVDRKDFQLIEHLIRKGRRQLELFQPAEVTAMRLQGAPGSSSGGSSSSGSGSTAARGALG